MPQSRPPAADHDHIELSRTLPLSESALADALVGLRREALGTRLRWSLGARGSLEVDARARPARAASRVVCTGTLRDPHGETVALVHLHAWPHDRATDITLAGDTRASRESSALARAALDELCEDLLWHAAREARARRAV
jgi:hypothetical protein